jgi:hypothetical protein
VEHLAHCPLLIGADEAQTTSQPDFDKLKQLTHLNTLIRSAGSSGQLPTVLKYLQVCADENDEWIVTTKNHQVTRAVSQVVQRSKPSQEELRKSGLATTLSALKGDAKQPARDILEGAA